MNDLINELVNIIDSNNIKDYDLTIKTNDHKIVKISPKYITVTCDHEWYATDLYEVEECYGAICKYCGKLSCMCEVNNSKYAYEKAMTRDPNGDLLGNMYYHNFYSNNSTNILRKDCN